MKFKDNILGKYWEFKQQNDFDYTVEIDCFGNDSYVYFFDIGIYVILERLLGMVLNPPKNKVLILLEYSSKEYKFNTVAKAIDFLMDKDTSKLNNITIQRKKEENVFLLYHKEGVIKEYISKRV